VTLARRKEADMLLSIVIPVYNSENTIEMLCENIVTHISMLYDLDIVLVNDGSTDNSDAICRRLQAEYPKQITYLQLSRNFGEHNALLAGLRCASGDLCVVMDDDLQNPPEEIPKLVDAMKHGYDVVYTSYLEKRDSFLRNMGSRFHNRVATWLLKKPANLYLSSFKIMNRFVVNEIVQYDGPDPYIDGIILRSTQNIGQISVRHELRLSGRSGYTFGKLFSLWGSMVVSFSLYPLRLIGLIGLVLIVIGGYYGIDTIREIVSPIEEPTDVKQLASIMTLYRGMQLLALSIVGEYVGRIYKSVNKDPQYIVREARRAADRAMPVSWKAGSRG
jgi:glycosyltransferase involved in cell wall biosynthesis